MRDAAEAKRALQDMSDAVKAETAAEVAGSTQAAAARQKDIASITQETQALNQLANAAKNTNSQLLYGGRNTSEQHLSDLAQELNYTTLLNRQKWLGFSSVQQAMAYRQQMYNLALLENRAHFAGYQTADQYLGFLQREISQTAALSAAIRDRSAAISAETQLLLAHANALQGTHQTAGSLGEGLSTVNAYNIALIGLPDTVTTRAVLDDSQAMAQLATYRAALAAIPHAETTDILSVATRLGGVPLTPQRETVPVTVRPQVDYAAVNRMLSQAVAGAHPEPVRAPLAISGSGLDPGEETDALSEAMATLNERAAVSEDVIHKFGESMSLAAVDARALEQGLTRLAAVQQLLAENAAQAGGTAQVGRSNRRRALTPGERTGNLASYYGLHDVAGALEQGQISNVPGGYPVPAPMQLVARPQEEDDLWAGLSQYMQGGKAEPQVSLQGGQQAETTLDKIAVQMEWLDHEDAKPKLELEGGQEALDDAYHLDGVLIGLTYERAEPEVELKGGPQAVTDAQLLANEMAHLNERSQTQLGVDFSEVEAARMAAEGLDEDLHEIPHEIDTVIEVDAAGAAREVRDYSADIHDIEREVGTRADFEDTDAESGLSRYLTALIEAVQRKYEFYASFNDDAAKAELASWIRELEDARAQENRLSAGMGGASGGGGGGGPPPSAPGGAGDAPDPDDARLWEDIARAMRDTDQAAIEAGRDLYDVKAGLGGMADPAAKAAAALKTDQDAALNMGYAVRLLRQEITLWSGLFGSTALIGQVAAWHILLDGIVEVLALWVPALATAAAGLIGFGAAGYQSFKEIYQQWQTLSTVGNALNTIVPPLTGNFQKLQDAVRPQVYQLLGDYLTVAGSKTGTFAQLINQTGDYLDKLGARITVYLQSGGHGLENFFEAGAKDLALIGQGFDSLGIILGKFIAATQITHIAEDLATVGDFILKIVADIVQLVPTPILAIGLAIHGIILWGGLAADAVGKTVIAVASLAGKLPALNAAAETVARTLGATNTQLVNIAKNSAEVGAVSEAMGAKASEEELAQLAVNIKATGASLEDFVNAAGTTSAARLSRFSEGLDDAGKKSVALGIAAGASDTQLAGMATKLGGVATATEEVGAEAGVATEAVAGGGGFLASLGALAPMLSNIYVDLGLLAAALVAVGVYLGTRADQTKQFTDAMGAAVQKASLLTVVSTTVSNLAEVTTTLNNAQKTGIGNASELAASQADLSGKLGEELTHVGDVSHAYGTNFVGALNLMNAAGVTTNQLFTTQSNVWAVAMQQVRGLITGYQAMGQQMGAIGNDLNALNLQNSQQVSSMDKLNQAYDAWIKTVGGAPSAFIALDQGFQTFSKDAAAAGASMTGLSAPSLQLQSDFQANYNNVETFFDAFRSDQALTGTGNFTQFVKDAVASLIPMAGGSKEAAAQISALAQEAGGPATTSISALQRWVGTIKDPLLAMYDASNQAAIGASNLSQDAARLSNTLQSLLDPAMANAIFNAHGGQKVFNDFADALAKGGPSSGATIAAAKNVATELLAVSGSSTSAKANFVGFAEASGLSAKQADQLWAQATKHISANLAQVRGDLAKNASQQSNLVKPGEVDTMLKSFKDGTFYELTFLAWIPQVQRGLNIMNHDIGQFFAHDIPAAAQVTGHAFEAAWDGMVNWFTQSVPHGFMDAWNPVSKFFDKAFTHDIPEAWNTAWANTVSPVTHAFDSVKSFVASSFDTWWKTHGSAVEAVWNAVWGQIRSDALGAWHFIESDAEGAWHIITGIFTSGPAKAFWNFISSGAVGAWQIAVSTARASWIEIEGLAKAAWDIVAAVAKIAWDVIWQFVGAGAKGAVDTLVGIFKAGWALVQAAAKIVWDTIVLLIDEVLDIITGHWQTAWNDLKNYGIQVWNALKTAGIQMWNALSTATLQVWTAIWNAIKTAAVQVWNALKTGAQQAWSAIWHSMQVTFVNPMATFFTSTVPKWWDSFANFASTTWSKVWTGFSKNVLQPVENWFTNTLPNAMWNSLKGGIDHVISGLNTVIGWINAVTSIVGVHISPISMLAAGGPAPHRLAQGSVPGTGDEDGTHIIAMGGEYILRKPARMALQAAFGPDFLDSLNHADTWLGAGSRGNAASQRPARRGRYASGGIPVISDIGNWLGDAGSAISGAASSVWHGITDVASEVAKYGEKAVFDAMWSVSGAPAQKAMEALGTPGDMGASWLQDVHNGVEGWITAQTAKAQAANKSTGSITGAGVSNASAEAALQSAAAKKGWTGAEWTALYDVEMAEAGFSLTATNPSSGAYGMAQFINGPSEYAQYGGNSTTAAGQAVAMVNYIASRYGDPEAAWLHEQQYHWYAGGGPVGGLAMGVMPHMAAGGPTVSGGHVISVDNNDAILGWNGQNASLYTTVIYGPGPINRHTGKTGIPKGYFEGLLAGHTYDVQVTPWNAAGKSGPSGWITLVTTKGTGHTLTDPSGTGSGSGSTTGGGSTGSGSTGSGSTGGGGSTSLPPGIGTPGAGTLPPGAGAGPTLIDLAPLIIGGPAATNAGGYGFNIASGGNVAAMFSGGLAKAAGGVVPNLFVPGLSANLSRQLTAATSGQLPRTLSDAAGNRVGLQVDQLTINNPVSEKPSESITRASNRLAFLGGRGMV